MTAIALLDVVSTTIPLPGLGIMAGAKGTVVEIYRDGVCEVEFADAEGQTIAMAALLPDQLSLVSSAPS